MIKLDGKTYLNKEEAMIRFIATEKLLDAWREEGMPHMMDVFSGEVEYLYPEEDCTKWFGGEEI